MKSINSSKGFTLIELLTVMAIIGVLAAIAIQQLSEIKKRSFDARARSDLINIATAQEAYYADYEKYLDCTNDTCEDLPGITKISEGVVVMINSSANGFTGIASHPSGTGAIFSYDSAQGGIQ